MEQATEAEPHQSSEDGDSETTTEKISVRTHPGYEGRPEPFRNIICTNCGYENCDVYYGRNCGKTGMAPLASCTCCGNIFEHNMVPR